MKQEDKTQDASWHGKAERKYVLISLFVGLLGVLATF